MMGPNFMNLRYVAEQPVAGSNLNQQFKVKDSGRSWMGFKCEPALGSLSSLVPG